MPCLPPPLGSLTVCEINRHFITADSLSIERARETYGKVIELVFSPIPFQTGLLLPGSRDVAEQEHNVASENVGFSSLKASFSELLTRFFSSKNLNSLEYISTQGISWHPQKPTLAFIAGPNQIMVRDYEDSEEKEPCILTSECQKDAKALEWRPNSGRTLSIACKGGICIWSASYPGNAASVRSGITSSVGNVSRGYGVRWTLVDFFKSRKGELVTALCWNPDGRFLATATHGSSSFTIWDVAQGTGTPIRRGLGAISILKWSPTGDYFFTAKFDGKFFLWETNTWTSEPWSSTAGNVTGAAWDPDGRMILIGFSESTSLGSIHFASKPPSLDAQLLPIELPELLSSSSSGIERIAWDASGERLAVSYKGGNEIYKGLIAVYDVRRAPLVSTSLIGFIRGPGDNPQPLAFSFQNKFKQGPLLSVCWNSGWCCTYPLLFRSHVLP